MSQLCLRRCYDVQSQCHSKNIYTFVYFNIFILSISYIKLNVLWPFPLCFVRYWFQELTWPSLYIIHTNHQFNIEGTDSSAQKSTSLNYMLGTAHFSLIMSTLPILLDYGRTKNTIIFLSLWPTLIAWLKINSFRMILTNFFCFIYLFISREVYLYSILVITPFVIFNVSIIRL